MCFNNRIKIIHKLHQNQNNISQRFNVITKKIYIYNIQINGIKSLLC